MYSFIYDYVNWILCYRQVDTVVSNFKYCVVRTNHDNFFINFICFLKFWIVLLYSVILFYIAWAYITWLFQYIGVDHIKVKHKCGIDCIHWWHFWVIPLLALRFIVKHVLKVVLTKDGFESSKCGWTLCLQYFQSRVKVKRKHVKCLYGNIVFENVPFKWEEVKKELLCNWCFHTVSVLRLTNAIYLLVCLLEIVHRQLDMMMK